jgi:Sugar-transfer associated ATP-grasp
MRLISSSQPYPPRNIIFLLIAVAIAYTVATGFAEIEFPAWDESTSSTFQLSLWLAAFASMMFAIIKLSARDVAGRISQWWVLAIITVASISVLQTDDLFIDMESVWTFSNPHGLDHVINALLAVMIASTLFISVKLPKKYAWAARCLQVTVAFQLFTIFSKLVETGSLFGNFHGAHQLSSLTDILADFSELLCIEFYVVGLALIRDYGVVRKIDSAVPFVRKDFVASGSFAGANARQAYKDCNLYRGAKHPPVSIAFYPVFQEITVFAVIFYLVFGAGRIIKRTTGKSLFRQAREMVSLWFTQGIDPPSYYALDLYKDARTQDAPHYLTRYETKNGLFATLNTRLPNPLPGNEMSNKELFAECCARYGIPHPSKLLTAGNGKIELYCSANVLKTDLFCKRQRGMGAVGTLAYRYKHPGIYIDENGQELDLKRLLETLNNESWKHPLLVQPWLKNHPSIADLALDSLITIRVLTCLNEFGSPEVTLAMLRLLTKLEPQWQNAPDEEYASPIDLATGELGLFTGDNMKTSHLRYENHPVTGAPIKGRILHDWPSIRDLAISAHAAFPHRLLVGWDIALTGKGPVVLEGNTNLDVMFLQRVHDAPIGKSRFGELLNYHLKNLYGKEMTVWHS